MSEESKRVRGFYQASRSWYFKTSQSEKREEFMIGIYHEGDGCEFELAIRWTDVNAWRLEVFDESWAGLVAEFGDLLKMLAELPKDASAEQIRAAIVAIGIEDLTNETPPSDVGARGLRHKQEEERKDMEARHLAEMKALDSGRLADVETESLRNMLKVP